MAKAAKPAKRAPAAGVRAKAPPAGTAARAARAGGQLAKLTRIHHASTDINEAILRARGSQELLDNACNILVRHFSFEAVSARLLSEDRSHLRLAATAGPLAGWVRQNKTEESTTGPGAGLSTQACLAGRVLVANDRAADARFTRDGMVREAGVRSSAALPLIRSGNTIGVLVLASQRKAAFDAALLGLLGHVADNMSFALEKFSQDEQRESAEQAMRRSEERFRSMAQLSSDVYWEQDADYCFVRVDQSTENAQLSADGRATRGKPRWELPDSAPLAGSWDEHRAVLAERQAYRNFEYRYRTADGSFGYVSSNGEPMFGADGRFTGYRGTARSITVAKRGEMALQRFRAAIDGSSDLVMLIDADSARLVDFNQAVCTSLGWQRDELLGKTLDMLIPGRSFADARDRLRATALKGQRDQIRSPLLRKDGTTLEVEVFQRGIASPEGDIVVGIARDITARLAGERRIREHARHQECITQFGREALGQRDLDRLFREATEAARTGLGACAVFLCKTDRANHPLSLLAAVKVASAADLAWPPSLAEGATERLAALQAGTVFDGAAAGVLPAEWSARFPSALIQPVRHAPMMYFVCLSLEAGRFSDDEASFLEAIASLLSTAVQRQESEARLAYLAQYDVLTGLANRSVIGDRLALAVQRARGKSADGSVVERRGPGAPRAAPGENAIAALFLDLDRFKLVNDTLGHAAGDQLLVETAKRLRDCVRQDDLVGRISGDEFVIILHGLRHADDAGLVARKVLQSLAAPFLLGGDEAFVSASVGIAIFPDDAGDAETLLKRADTAMYRAKETGRNGYCFYTADMNERSQQRLQLAVELRRALDRQEFRLFYQPKLSLADGTLCGMEALLRWQHPERGLLGPGEIIPVLEETGLIIAVGDWVLGEACAQLRRWHDAGQAMVPVAVNVSARQFRDKNLPSRIQECAAAAGIEVSRIEIEITESHLIENPAAAREALQALRAAGIRIAVDDFGTGHSSLSYLTQFPLTALKIDRSFVHHATSRADAASIVRAIVSMAQGLQLITIAEGVEDERQAQFLRELGCDQAQGFLYSKPLAPDEAVRFMETTATP